MQSIRSMEFANQAGETLVFENTNFNQQNDKNEFPVETLCERGDFLDKTVQTAYYKTDAFHQYFVTAGQKYTISIDATLNNAGEYGEKEDTAFYETFVVFIQKISSPIATSALTMISSDRGNDLVKFNQYIEDTKNEVFIADTTISGTRLQNVFMNTKPGPKPVQIFYSKTKGLELFMVSEDETWVRKNWLPYI